MWFVLDNALVLPEYLVEFEYVTNLKGLNEESPILKKSGLSSNEMTQTSEQVNEECNKLLEAINGSQ